MTSVKHPVDGGERLVLQRKLGCFFGELSLLPNSSIFNKELMRFLLFNYQFITEPHHFHCLVQKTIGGAYIGSLKGLSEGEWDGNCVFVSTESTLPEISQAFNEDAGPEDGPIQLYIETGFVAPASEDWIIWFSTYWEIAIAAFPSDDSAAQFMKQHRHISFQTRRSVADYYRMNPQSEASSMLAYYLQRNCAE